MENPKNTHVTDKDQSIVIIGAGAAGLTAASTLKNLGYRNIVILERSQSPGGKCSSIDIEGRRYEMGAGIISGDDESVIDLVKKYHIPIQQVTFGKGIVIDEENNIARKNSLKDIILLGKQLRTYRALQKKYAPIEQPGFAHINGEDLSLPFTAFAQKHKIEALAKELELSHTGFGYGYFDQVPTAYVLKYYSWPTILSYFTHRIYFFPNGIQELWKAVAKDFNVKYGITITDIKRNQACSIAFKSTESEAPETIVCDRLIVTSPLDELPAFIDAAPQENELFSAINHLHYYTIACSVVGFFKSSGFAPGNFSTSRAGHPVFWYHRHPETDIFIFYILDKDKNTSEDALKQHISDFVKTMGGELKKVHRTKYWKYFPHVSPEHIKAGYYDTLEQMQGTNHTYYAGELLNFSTVGRTSQYAKSLVERFF